MKTRMAIALGTGVGTVVYQIARYGIAEVDWARAVFIAAGTLLVLFVIPRRWIENDRRQHAD